MSQLGGWQIVGPLSGKGTWQWSASGAGGLRSESGAAATQDEARQLAHEAYRRLNNRPPPERTDP